LKRATAGVLGLALLIALAFFLHRGAREEKPLRPPKPAAVVEPMTPEPLPIAALAPETPKLPLLPATPRPPAPKATEVPPVVGEPAPGFIRGVVKILGEPPKRRLAKLYADPKCADLHPGGILRDDIVVDLGNNVQWAFVYIAKGVKGTPKAPLLPVLLDQVGCRFEPHVLGVRVNQPINIYNNDRLLHTVHAMPYDNKEFNLGLPEWKQFETRTFTRPEIMIRVKCDIHPWMWAWIGVLDHPYFSVTSETGSYGIAQVPPGRYTVRVWHELYASVDREVEIEPGADVRLDFFLDARKTD